MPFTSEIVDCPNSGSLVTFHALLGTVFGPEEVEPLETFQAELQSNASTDATARYLFLALHDNDPGSADSIVAYGYASVQDGLLAVRFVVVGDQGACRSGLGRRVVAGLQMEAERWSAERGQPLRAYFAECVDESEPFFNRVLQMRRLYYPNPEGTGLREMYYELPHLGDWARDGTPLPLPGKTTIEAKCEHLQLAVDGHTERLPLAEIKKILNTLWHEWYVHPESDFNDHAAWQRHYARVINETLQQKILAPLDQHGELILLSREEREERRRDGAIIEDLKL